MILTCQPTLYGAIVSVTGFNAVAFAITEV
jgi:hypothetical protein